MFQVTKHSQAGTFLQVMLHNRPIIDLSRTSIVVEKTEHDGTHSPNDTEVHGLNSHHPRRWPEAKEDSNSHINQSPGIDKNAPNAWHMEWAPDELRAGGVDDSGIAAANRADPARATTPEEKTANHHVRQVETGDRHGAEVVEGDRGANVDERKEAGNHGCHQNGVYGDGRVLGDL